MAVVKMKKMTLAAPQGERDSILSLLQTKGCVELIDLKDEAGEEGLGFFKEAKSVSDVEIDYNRIKFTYEFLRSYHTKKKGLLAKREIISKQEFDNLGSMVGWKDIFEQCKSIDEAINQNKNKRTKNAALIDQYKQWKNLDVSNKDLDGLKRTAYFIGTISKKYDEPLYEELRTAHDGVYIEKVWEEKQDINLFILCHKDDKEDVSEILKKYGFTRANLDLTKTPAEAISDLENEIENLKVEMDKLNEKASSLTENITDIEKMFDYMTCRLNKEKVVSNLVKTDKTFIMQGWIREDEIDVLKEEIQKNFSDTFIEFEDPSEGDIPPTVLKNNAFVEPFESITSMYALPLHTEVDPTPVLTPFYLIFFGMMAADIGYGLVMLLATGFALKFMDLEGGSRKMAKLLFYVSIPTILFGWAFGGFFGDAIPIKPLWVNPVDDPLAILLVSIVIGVIHLFTGLGVKAYWLIKHGKILDAVYDVFFWYVLLVGLMWLLLGGGTVPKILSIAGALGLLLTQGRENKSIVGKFFGGVYGLYGVTSYIGDVLSYSRLLALGLATGLIGSSFNLLIRLLGNGPIAIIFGALIFVGGHVFNLLIGMLGTFVHACRLEYLEFFGKFYEGGGKAFNPLKITTKFIKVNTES